MAFKIGDKVIRMREYYNGMKPGDTDIIIKVEINSINLKEFGNGHSHNNLAIYKITNWKERIQK